MYGLKLWERSSLLLEGTEGATARKRSGKRTTASRHSYIKAIDAGEQPQEGSPKGTRSLLFYVNLSGNRTEGFSLNQRT